MKTFTRQENELVEVMAAPDKQSYIKTNGEQGKVMYAEAMQNYCRRKNQVKRIPIHPTHYNSFEFNKVYNEDEFEVIEFPDLFIEGNYKNTCVYCKCEINGTDKLWFMCRDCAGKSYAIPKQNESEDDIYDEIEGVFDVYLNWEMFRDKLKQKFIITKR